jgi:uncharacterized membrane protein
MTSHKKKTCSICQEKFQLHDLYPNALIRDNLYKEVQASYPEITREGFICYPDYRKQNAKYYERILQREKGRLSNLEKEVIESLKEHEFISENTNDQFEDNLTLGERLSDKLAKFGGSWTFIIAFFTILCGWMIVNSAILMSQKFDPFPFILLNLVLSCLAAIQAPIILMSQNRQAAKDRIKSDQDYLVNLKAELQIRQLNSRFDVFMKHHLQIMNDILQSQEELQEEVEKRNLSQIRIPKFS